MQTSAKKKLVTISRKYLIHVLGHFIYSMTNQFLSPAKWNNSTFEKVGQGEYDFVSEFKF